jgi:hypothetical protein
MEKFGRMRRGGGEGLNWNCWENKNEMKNS